MFCLKQITSEMDEFYFSILEHENSDDNDGELFQSENLSTFSHAPRQRTKSSSTAAVSALNSNTATTTITDTFMQSIPNPSIDFKAFLPPQLNKKAELDCLLNKKILYSPAKKASTFHLNVTEAADYLSKRFEVFRIDNALYFYNWTSGIHERQSQIDSHAIMKCYFDSLDNSIWQCQFADGLYKAFLTSAPAKKHIIPVANYLAFPNGTLALDTMKFQLHSPQYGTTNVIPHKYEPSAKCPIFDKTLAEIFANDTSMIDCFWEMFGYFLYYGTDYPLQKFFIFLGEGSNGKSLLLKAIRYTLGDTNCSGTRLEEISSSDFGASMFFGKMLNISPETEPQKAISTGLLKSVTGGDAITINKKNKAPFSANVYTKFLLAANDVFPINDNSHGIFRRMQVFPFTQTFQEIPPDGYKKPGILYADKNLFVSIKPEVSGIINQALEGLQRLKKNNWTMTASQACDDALRPFQSNMPSALIHDFCSQYLKSAVNSRVKQTAVKDLFKQFLDDSGVDRNTKHSLTSRRNLSNLYANIEVELQKLYPDAGIHCNKSNGYQVYQNVSLTCVE